MALDQTYADLIKYGVKRPQFSWLSALAEKGQHLLDHSPHGDMPRWLNALADLPHTESGFSCDQNMPALGPANNTAAVQELLMAFHPWRKGPLSIGGITIDTEWRSDWKWDRIAPHLDIEGHTILDIGCGNGYFGWRMLDHGARMVIGVDPTWVFVMQWLACRHFAGGAPNFVLPMGVEDLPDRATGFDTVFSMGVLYHRRNALSHLQRLASLTRSGGQVVLETLVLKDDKAETLIPEGRYARMRNVWAVPSVPTLQTWMREAGLRDIRLLDVSTTTVEEQRSTDWMTFESLDKCLDPDNPSLTVEGHPAPVRAALLAST